LCILERHIKITKAQDALLRKLENGSEVTFKDGHYVIVGDHEPEKIWPSTFYGLYDHGLVKTTKTGYTVSEDGIKQIRGESG